jgi:hypothetical protein
MRRRTSVRNRNVGVANAFSLRNLTAAAWRSRGSGVKFTPCWPPDFCCELNPPTMGTTWFNSRVHWPMSRS